MHEKIQKLRNKLIEELSKLEDGIHIKLDYDKDILELIIFGYLDSNNLNQHRNIIQPFSTKEIIVPAYTLTNPCIDEKGVHTPSKIFALPKEILSKIDFTNVSFDNFKAKDYDFSNLYGVRINPQTIYIKDIRNAILKGVKFIGPFDNTIISGADFTGSKGAIIDPSKLNQSGCCNIIPQKCKGVRIHEYEIEMKNCKFSDVTFIEELKSIKVEKDGDVYCYAKPLIDGADFTGSKGTRIFLASPYNYYQEAEINNCILRDAVVFIPKNAKLKLNHVNFSGAQSENIFGFPCPIRLNPQNIVGSMEYTIFDGVEFTGPFDGTEINGVNFTGSRGAVIDLRTIKKNTSFIDTNFTDARVIGYNGETLIPLEDGRISQSIEEKIDVLLNGAKLNTLLKQKDLEEARLKLIEANREKLKNKIAELLKIVVSTEHIGLDPANIYCKVPIEQELFLVKIDDHYEINRNIIDLSLLRFFNLSTIDFTNVKVSGIDFRFSQARINPQLVYQKDISNCIFDKGNIKFFDDFTGVNIEGTNFDNCDFNPKVLKKV